ncbi:DUF4209 domain-containing protein [Lentzea sp. BCCO 10_0798]|uniref:DUF4209 domain-containing protein n=1 Tax=Lentzea kristufekii TaxID=3095430 RepID=A0ABU4TWZ9_9PSEU|nr:DUF4209 domain-containing protein [Lentzea sp. BCCO 10_0798]MDX8052853.1 DUF4209 domain-containing protein [Lentzea sp. BCCO 10_0798]
MTTQDDHTIGLAATLDSFAAEGSRFNIEQRLRQEVPQAVISTNRTKEQTDSTAIQFAFTYTIQQKMINGKPRATIEGKYRNPDGTQSPPPVDEVPQEIVDSWADLSEKVNAPYARARLEHLLFARRHGNAVEHAEKAITAYRKSSKTWKRSLDQINDLSMALRLSRAIGNASLSQEVMAEIISAATAALESKENIPGISLRLIAVLATEPNAPAELDELLKKARSRYKGDPWIEEDVVDFQIDRASDATRATLQDELVQIWLDAGEASAGIVRLGHLKKALEIANRIGRNELVNRAAAAIQATNPAELELMSIKSTVNISEEMIELLIQPVTSAPSWRDALDEFARFGPISGDRSTNEARVQQQAQDFPLQAMLPPELLGGDGLPRFYADTPERQFDVALSKIESQQIKIYGAFLAEALHRIARTHGIPTEADLTDFFLSRKTVSEVIAGALARAHIRFWTGDAEAVMFCTPPIIEALARQLVIDTQQGVYRLQRQDSPGQYPGLGSLLGTLLTAGLDPSWFRYLHTLCTSIAGMNLRNEVAHGFTFGHSASITATLLQAAGYLSCLAGTPDEADSDEGTGSAEPE